MALDIINVVFLGKVLIVLSTLGIAVMDWRLRMSVNLVIGTIIVSPVILSFTIATVE